MINKNISLSLSDVSIVPEVISNINSRTECIPYVNGMLPLFTAPMSCVVSLDNINIFKKNLITPIVPKNINFDKRIENLIAGNWVAFSLDEFEETFSKSTTFKDIRDNSITRFVSSNGLVLDANNTYYALIDIANGHMNRLKEAIEKAKFNYEKHIVIMAGNIANPKTYVELSNAGADYIRVGIGGGSGCLTTSNTGVHYPMASLIDECRKLKKEHDLATNIVADGGMKGYSDIIKSLALGADYVMCGSLFNQLFESSGVTMRVTNNICSSIVNQYDEAVISCFINRSEREYYTKEMYGMSTRQAQLEMGATKTKTSEGLIKTNKCTHTISGWVNNFTDYLKSAMSYTNSRNLDQFIGEVELSVNSLNASNSYNK